MRISDWCSNVCSSDLQPDDARKGVDDDQLAVLRPRDQQPAVVGAEIDRTIALRSRERGGAGWVSALVSVRRHRCPGLRRSPCWRCHLPHGYFDLSAPAPAWSRTFTWGQAQARAGAMHSAAQGPRTTPPP